MPANANDNRAYRKSYAVLDVELLNDNEAFAKYKRLDFRAASLRWPFRRVCAAALLTFSVDEDGRFEFGHLDSWAGDDEAALLRVLFNRLRMLPEYELITWGGLSCDLLILRMSAMEHGLRLPKQLVHGAREYGRWLHRDLAVEMRGGGGVFVHMSEVATRLNLPVKFADKASSVPVLMAEGKLRRVAGIAEADVLTTAMVACSMMEIHGELSGAAGAHQSLIQRLVSERPEARYREYLERVSDRMLRDFGDRSTGVAA